MVELKIQYMYDKLSLAKTRCPHLDVGLVFNLQYNEKEKFHRHFNKFRMMLHLGKDENVKIIYLKNIVIKINFFNIYC